ncbi:MAG: oligopeptide ABC transporter, periplasmic oligopeptide-binding protein [Osedax symbiont Rs1]|nr:MAG: oligopeptide ABC transporter, periplasmic oligopeptide-binding protein [Osedax symbiont Rs1]
MTILLQRLLLCCLFSVMLAMPAHAIPEVPILQAQVASGALPPVAQRLPSNPAKPDFTEKQIGQYGGQIRMLMGKAKDIRMMVVYGYSRLVGYDAKLNLQPDILQKVDVQEGRIFTLHIRPGHRWSDGVEFTAEDFRFFWQDKATHPVLAPYGPPPALMRGPQIPHFEVLDKYTVRYTWLVPNPYFLPALAGPSPLFIYMPAHYMKQFHSDHIGAEAIAIKVKVAKKRNWRGLFVSKGRQYKLTNPKLPTLQPWMNTTTPPAERFVFKRNPYFHRVDPEGKQLPYVDEVIINISSSGLVPAKTGSGESDLQARYLRLDNYTFLKAGEKTNNYKVNLWGTGRGAHVALYPNLTAKEPKWRKLMQNADFRRALSLGVNREEINQVVYFGLALSSANTVLPQCPLYKEEYGRAYAQFDPQRANQLLDKIGLTNKDGQGIRLFTDGTPVEILVQTAGESTEQTDVLALVKDSWRRIGIKMYIKPIQREVLRNRVFSGAALMTTWFGLPNGLPVAQMSPEQLAPTRQDQYQWSQWGRHFETGEGEAPTLPKVQRLVELNDAWTQASNVAQQRAVWHEMLAIHADQVYSIGLVSGILQPVVVNKNLRNVPQKAFYNWNPGAFFGIYNMASFWYQQGKN